MRETKKQIMEGVTGVVSSKVIGPNTVQYTRADGALRLYSGGWRSLTTADRIRQIVRQRGYVLWIACGVWFISKGQGYRGDGSDRDHALEGVEL